MKKFLLTIATQVEVWANDEEEAAWKINEIPEDDRLIYRYMVDKVEKIRNDPDEKVIEEIKKEIEKIQLPNCSSFCNYNEDEKRFELTACCFSLKNAFDYGEKCPYKKDKFFFDSPELAKLYKQYPEYFEVETCNICCGCGGW